MAYIGKQPVVGNFVKLDAIVTSATTTFNLLNGGVAYSPQSANNCIVSLNGIIQEPTSSGNVGGYTISGSTIVFTSALTTLDVIDFILVLGDTLSIGTPSDGTVSFAKVTSNLITGATAETSIAGGDSVLIYDDSASALRKMTRTNFVAGVGGTNTPAFYVSASAGTTMSSAYTDYIMTFDTEVVDSDNCFNTTTYRFTPNVAGYYFLNVRIGAYWGYGRSFATSPHNLIVSIYKNGSGFRGQAWPNSFAQNCNCHNGGMTISTIAYANGSTDYFTIYSWADVAGYSMSGSEFSGFKLIGV